MNTEFTAKKILVTGGAGFIGSHLVESLLEKGSRVTVVDNLSTGSAENVEHLESAYPEDFRLVVADAAVEEIMEPLARDTDIIFHLAAAVGVELVVTEPVKTIENNLDPTRTALELASRYRKRILIASTSEVYGRSEKESFSENDDCVIGPSHLRRWTYAASKLMDEFLARAYFHERRLKMTVVRLFNTVGPRQTGRYGMVVPRFVGQALEGRPITVYGDGRQSRSFTHVSDVVTALEKLAFTEKAVGEVFNIGSGNEININQLAEKIIQLTGSKSQIENISYERAFGENFEDIRRRVPDIKKLKGFTGFTPERNLDQILKDVIQHLKTQKKSP